MPEPRSWDRPGPDRVEVVAVPGLPEVVAGDDLAAVILAALDGAGVPLVDGDVVVVSSKVVSKAGGRTLRASSRDAAIDAETARVVAERSSGRGVTRIVQARSGPVLAAAGVDASNVEPGTVLLLPADPDAAAAALRRGLESVSGVRVGVVVSDTGGRAWRDGQTDFALGVAGVRPVDDLRGATDTFGNPLEVTVRALVDELAAAADLVKGKLHKVPAAVVRGLGDLVTTEDGPGARSLLRTVATDWFALGHVEAVRTALGVPPGTPGVDLVPVVPDPALPRLRRALDVALAAPDPLRTPPADVFAPVSIELREDGAVAALAVLELPGPASPAPRTLLAVGALAQRIVAAAWSEGLDAEIDAAPGRLVVSARLRG